MIGNMYWIAIAAESQSAVKTLIELATTAACIAFVERVYLSQSTQDSSENLSCKIQHATASGTGTATTPQKSEATAACLGTQKTNMTVEPTYTSGKIWVNEGWNTLAGFKWTPSSDEEIIVIPPSLFCGIRLHTAPLAAISFDYGCTFRQIG
jgi:hypothetical protein